MQARRASDPEGIVIRVALLEEKILQHVLLCDKRAALAQKLMITCALMGLGTLGFLIKIVSHLPPG